MKLLFEEFFESVFKLSKGGSWTLKILIKLINLGIILGIVFFVLYSFFSKKYVLLLIFLGLVIIAECAHFIRKSIEKSLSDKGVKKNIKKNMTNDLINPDDSKNDVLLKSSKSKNKVLLNSGKSKNNVLLSSSKSKVLLKGNVKKIKAVSSEPVIKQIKNDNLLGLNKELLKKKIK